MTVSATPEWIAGLQELQYYITQCVREHAARWDAISTLDIRRSGRGRGARIGQEVTEDLVAVLAADEVLVQRVRRLPQAQVLGTLAPTVSEIAERRVLANLQLEIAKAYLLGFPAGRSQASRRLWEHRRRNRLSAGQDMCQSPEEVCLDAFRNIALRLRFTGPLEVRTSVRSSTESYANEVIENLLNGISGAVGRPGRDGRRQGDHCHRQAAAGQQPYGAAGRPSVVRLTPDGAVQGVHNDDVAAQVPEALQTTADDVPQETADDVGLSVSPNATMQEVLRTVLDAAALDAYFSEQLATAHHRSKRKITVQHNAMRKVLEMDQNRLPMPPKDVLRKLNRHEEKDRVELDVLLVRALQAAALALLAGSSSTLALFWPVDGSPDTNTFEVQRSAYLRALKAILALFLPNVPHVPPRLKSAMEQE